MTATTRRQLMAGSLAAIGAAGAPAVVEAKSSHTPATIEQWERLFRAMRRLTPQQLKAALDEAEALLGDRRQS